MPVVLFKNSIEICLKILSRKPSAAATDSWWGHGSVLSCCLADGAYRAGIMVEYVGQGHLSAWEHLAWQLSSVLSARHLGTKQTVTCDGIESTPFGLPAPTSSTLELRCCGAKGVSKCLVAREEADSPLSLHSGRQTSASQCPVGQDVTPLSTAVVCGASLSWTPSHLLCRWLDLF
ncbi:hypothetical protein ABBQ38_015417 [Trebouxia sp. C0009 RCD-2024]